MDATTALARDDARLRMCAWFIGPKAENLDYFLRFFDRIVEDMQRSRLRFGPSDKPFVEDSIRASESFIQAMTEPEALLAKVSECMAEHSVPMYSPRYMAHMVSENSLPGVLGYILGLLYNQNNVAMEVSPVTTMLEWEVGQQLCNLLGYKRHPRAAKDEPFCAPFNIEEPYAWGHLTCDGSVANLESIWAARNLQFYPLSLRNDMTKRSKKTGDLDHDAEMPPPLAFAYDTFEVSLCSGESKLFKNCSTWELLNVPPDAILSIPTKLTAQYGVSPAYIQAAMREYDVQTVGKDELVRQYDCQQPVYFISKTRHYSWPKSAGIGSENLVGIEVDYAARMNTKDLQQRLEESLTQQKPVYCVVVIIGTTEHGAVDPLLEVVALRKEYQRRGLSFLIHADATWGGYFAALRRPLNHAAARRGTILRDYTNEQLHALKFADSITIDPHKAGYVPYPGGGLCYKDERLRCLLTWISTYSMGVYGIEGSKLGASAVAAFLSHEVIGLNEEEGGYPVLLAEAVWTSLKLYCSWVTMDTGSDGFKVTPLHMLPSEIEGGDIDAEKEFIRSRIRRLSDCDLRQDPDVLALFSRLGSDLMINTFACNFRIGDTLNDDVEEANYFNKRIFEELSVVSVTDKPSNKGAILMATSLSQDVYGECLTAWKIRMGLVGNDVLYVLCNASTSPFSTAYNFLEGLVRHFENVAREVTIDCRWRNSVTPDLHTFLLQGTGPVYLVYLPTFIASNGRNQVVLQVDIPTPLLDRYLTAESRDSSQFFTVTSAQPLTLESIMHDGASFEAYMNRGYPKLDHEEVHFSCKFTVSNVRIVRWSSLEKRHLAKIYPIAMPFFLYGDPKEAHLDHILTRAPNAQICASGVQLEFAELQSTVEKGLASGWIAVMNNVPEHIMQPFTPTHLPILFDPVTKAQKFAVSIYQDTGRWASPLPPTLLENSDVKLLTAMLHLALTSILTAIS